MCFNIQRCFPLVRTTSKCSHNNNEEQEGTTNRNSSKEGESTATKDVNNAENRDDFADLEMKIYSSNAFNDINISNKLIIEQVTFSLGIYIHLENINLYIYYKTRKTIFYWYI